MGSQIKRWAPANTQAEVRQYRTGEWVLHSDHKEVVAELRKQLRTVSKERDLLDELFNQYSARVPDRDKMRRAHTRYWTWVERQEKLNG